MRKGVAFFLAFYQVSYLLLLRYLLLTKLHYLQAISQCSMSGEIVFCKS